MRIKWTYSCSWIFLLLFMACAKEVTQEDLIQAALEIKLKQWEESELKLCKEKAFLDAESYVDSLMVAISLGSKLDTIPSPEKPNKPPKPVFKEKPDSVVVSPIYKKNE